MSGDTMADHLSDEMNRLAAENVRLERELGEIHFALGPYALNEDEKAVDTLRRLIALFQPHPSLEAQRHPGQDPRDAGNGVYDDNEDDPDAAMPWENDEGEDDDDDEG